MIHNFHKHILPFYLEKKRKTRFHNLKACIHHNRNLYNIMCLLKELLFYLSFSPVSFRICNIWYCKYKLHSWKHFMSFSPIACFSRLHILPNSLWISIPILSPFKMWRITFQWYVFSYNLKNMLLPLIWFERHFCDARRFIFKAEWYP